MILRLSLVLVGDAEGISLFFIQIDLSAADKAVFLQQVLHDKVIVVGVGPNVRADLQAEVQTGLK